MSSRVVHIMVWHPGYVCKVAVTCSSQDLRNYKSFTQRIALALFDHGVDPCVIDRLKKHQLYYAQHSTLVPISKPIMIPPNSNVVSKDVCLKCDDPLFFRIEVDPRTVLPIRLPETPLRTLDSIKQHIIRVLSKNYGVVCDTSTFHVHYARWTLGVPTRRHFSRSVVRAYPVACRTAPIHAAASCMQTKLVTAWRWHRRRNAATCIQTCWRVRAHRVKTTCAVVLQRAWWRRQDQEWTSITNPQTPPVVVAT